MVIFFHWEGAIRITSLLREGPESCLKCTQLECRCGSVHSGLGGCRKLGERRPLENNRLAEKG